MIVLICLSSFVLAEDFPNNHCGNGICEPPENQDRCCGDCGGCMGDVKRAGDDALIGQQEDKKKGFFSKIIDFFRNIFRHKEPAKQVMTDNNSEKKVYIDGKEVPYKTEDEVPPGTAMRVIETGTGEKIYVEGGSESSDITVITGTK